MLHQHNTPRYAECGRTLHEAEVAPDYPVHGGKCQYLNEEDDDDGDDDDES